MIDRADPPVQQVVQLLQARHRVPGRMSVVAGDLDQELLLDSLERAFYFSPAHRAARRAVGQLDAQHRARPGQRLIGKTRAVVGIQDLRDAVPGDRGAQHAGEPDRVGAADELAAGQEPGPVIDDGRQVAGPAGHGGPFIRSAVQISFTASAVNRPKACGGAPSGRVVSSRAANQRWMARSEGAQPSRAARIRRTCAAVRAGFSIFRPTASSTTSASVRGKD